MEAFAVVVPTTGVSDDFEGILIVESGHLSATRVAEALNPVSEGYALCLLGKVSVQILHRPAKARLLNEEQH